MFDPFHVVQLANRAVDDVRRADWREHGKSKTKSGRWIKHARWSLLKAPERQSEAQLARLAEVAATNKRLYRAFLLKEELRLLYDLPDPSKAAEHLAAWLGWASRSKLRPFVKLARTIRKYRDGILAAVRLGMSNARLEGLNSKVRLISHRSYRYHGPKPLISLIYLSRHVPDDALRPVGEVQRRRRDPSQREVAAGAVDALRGLHEHRLFGLKLFAQCVTHHQLP